MRNCPICDYDKVLATWLYDTGEVHIHACGQCGHAYVDEPAMTQEWWDAWYQRGDTSPDLHDEATRVRLQALADYVKPLAKGGRVLDIGGMYSEFKDMVPNCTAIGAGMPIEGKYAVIVVSHCLEHVYAMNEFMTSVRDHLKPRGKLVVEVPIFDNYAGDPMYDFLWIHINKFRRPDLVSLFARFGFANLRGEDLPDMAAPAPIPPWKCYRMEGTKYAGK